jgi:DNA-binding NtrC family response regulator
MGKVLVVDDDAQMRTVLCLYLKRMGHQVTEAATVTAARALQASESPDLTIVDYHLPDGTAFDIIGSRTERDGAEAVIVLTGVGTIELAVQAIKAGAEHFLTKPVDLESLDILVRRTLEAQRDRRQQLAAASANDIADPFIGQSPKILALKEMATAVLDSTAPVLILGETGTGKSLLARFLHARSPRASEAFVDLNCAGLPRELVESELFGHRRGAFTGAVTNKPGLFEVAHRGTLFLDEIGDLELAVQPKLLKALEEGGFRRVGEVANRGADVRLIAATHRNLRAMVKQEKFREDLLFRINTLVFELPSLRERMEDLEQLATMLVSELCRGGGRRPPRLGDEAVEMLRSYDWPGNIRELKNVLERALLFCKSDVLDRKTLRFDRALDPGGGTDEALRTLDEAERVHIVNVLRSTGGHVEKAAEVLALSRSSLYARLKKYGIKAEGV